MPAAPVSAVPPPAGRTVRAALVCTLLAGCAGGDDWFPLQPGQIREYRLTTEVRKEVRVQKHVVVDLGGGEYEGTAVHVQRAQDGELAYLRRSDAGIERVAVRPAGAGEPAADAPGHFLLRFPATPGTRWQLASRLRLVESRTFAREDLLRPHRLPVQLEYAIEALDDTVDVPAGRYPGCLRVRGTGRTTVPVDRATGKAGVEVEHTDWYAPGVGLVKSTRIERTDSVFLHPGSYALELERLSR